MYLKFKRLGIAVGYLEVWHSIVSHFLFPPNSNPLIDNCPGNSPVANASNAKCNLQIRRYRTLNEKKTNPHRTFFRGSKFCSENHTSPPEIFSSSRHVPVLYQCFQYSLCIFSPQYISRLAIENRYRSLLDCPSTYRTIPVYSLEIPTKDTKREEG